jgi:tetratricopeptide (TPR) repeat protein
MRRFVRRWRGAVALVMASVVLLGTSRAMAASPTTKMTAAPAPTLDQANAAFEAGKFSEAIVKYRSILATKGYSAAVLFDLGNAYYQDAQFGPAILGFERALVILPGDPAVERNLQLARQRAGVPAPAADVAERAAGYFSVNTLAWTGSAALAVACIAMGMGWLLPKSVPVRAIAGVGFAVLLAATAAILVRWNDFDRAIVLTANTPARIAPAADAASSFTLKAGEPVTIAKQYGRFALARTPDGRCGWVGDSQIGRVYAETPEPHAGSGL